MVSIRDFLIVVYGAKINLFPVWDKLSVWRSRRAFGFKFRISFHANEARESECALRDNTVRAALGTAFIVVGRAVLWFSSRSQVHRLFEVACQLRPLARDPQISSKKLSR